MTEPIVLRRPFVIAAVTLLQIMMPPVVAVGSLVAIMGLYGIDSDRKYGVLVSLVTILSAVSSPTTRHIETPVRQA